MTCLFILFLCFFSIFSRTCHQQKKFNYPLFRQWDSRWAEEKLGFSKTTTIHQAGCCMCSAAMAVVARGKHHNHTHKNPHNFNHWLKENHGYVNVDNYVWASIHPFGLEFKGFIGGSDHSKIVTAICDDDVIVLNVHEGHHFVLAVGCDDTGYHVHDPAYSTTKYTFGQVVQASHYKVGVSASKGHNMTRF